VYFDYITNLVPTFVGEGYAAEVVVTGKGSLPVLPVFRPKHLRNGQHYHRSNVRAHLLASIDYDLSSSLQRQTAVAFPSYHEM